MQTNLLSQKHGMEHQAPGHAETQVCNSTFILLFFVTFRILVSGRKSEQVQGVPEKIRSKKKKEIFVFHKFLFENNGKPIFWEHFFAHIWIIGLRHFLQLVISFY